MKAPASGINQEVGLPNTASALPHCGGAPLTRRRQSARSVRRHPAHHTTPRRPLVVIATFIVPHVSVSSYPLCADAASN